MKSTIARLGATLSTLALCAGVGLATATPAMAETERCRPYPVGVGGLDTFRVCTTVGVSVVEGRASFYSSRARTGPENVDIFLSLYRDGEEIRSNACSFDNVRPNVRLDCETPLAGNVSGQQNYYVEAVVVVDDLTPVIGRSPNNYG